MQEKFKMIAMVVLLGTAMSSCKKNERLPDHEKVIVHPQLSLTTDELIKFMAEIGHINVNEITYEEKEQQFIWRESKTSKSDLILMYEQHQQVIKVTKENAN